MQLYHRSHARRRRRIDDHILIQYQTLMIANPHNIMCHGEGRDNPESVYFGAESELYTRGEAG